MTEQIQTTVYSQLMALRDRQRALQAESPFVVRSAEVLDGPPPQGDSRDPGAELVLALLRSPARLHGR